MNQELKPVKDWFSFEGRCLVCGRRYHREIDDGHRADHLGIHVTEGVLVKEEDEAYRQVKPHPLGFPGILLPEGMNFPKCSTEPVRAVWDFSNS